MEKSSAPKRFLVGFNITIQVVLVFVVLVLINLAMNRWHPPRFDLSQSNYYKLSDKTKQLLKSLKAPIEVIVFFQPDTSDPMITKIFNDIQNLLREYEAESSQIKVRYVDPDRDPINAEKLANEYHVKFPNVVIFVYNKQSKYVEVSDLVELDRAGSPFTEGGSRVKAFKGEQQFTSALQKVLDTKQPKIYFLEGHGEGDPTNFDPRTGYSNITTYIRRDNLLVEKLNIFEKQQIPRDCDVLMICDPTKPLGEIELKAIQDYLNQNGRLMVFLAGFHNESGIEKLLTEYGVKVGHDVVLIKFRDVLGGERVILGVPGTNYGNHPITEVLRKENIATFFPNAQSVSQISPTIGLKERVTVLVKTPDFAWAETDLAKLQQGKTQFNEKDHKGPVPIAVAVEPITAGKIEREGARMVVFGSSEFIRNGQLRGGNVDLFMNALNWLLQRQQLVGIAPKMPAEFSLLLDVFQRRAIFATEVVIVPLVITVIGLLVWFQRRK